MKKASFILKPLLALSLLLQGTSLTASCAMPCRMNAADRLHCVVASLLKSRQARANGAQAALRPRAMACGSLHLQAPVSGVAAPGPQIQAPLLSYSLPEPSLGGLAPAQAAFIAFMRAGPSGPAANSAFPAVPPQNAPPSLV
jgi:hypothetical protein